MKTKETNHNHPHVNAGKSLADEIYRNCLGGGNETAAMTEQEKEDFIAAETKYHTKAMTKNEEKNLEELRRKTRERLSATLGLDLEETELPERKTVRKKELRPWFRLRMVSQAAAAVAVTAVLLAGGSWGYKELAQYRKLTASAGKLMACAADSSLLLSDGTSIRMQGGSRLVAASDFGRHERRITLNGQACIHAATDSTRPYIVDMPHGLSLEVKGTEFNVNAYADNPVTEITVLGGCVEIRNERKHTHYGSFRAGDHLAYNCLTGEVVKDKVDVTRKTAWMDKRFELEKASVDEFRQKMFDVFGKNIIVRGEAFGKGPVLIHASFNHVKNLTYKTVLDDLQQLYHYRYTSKGNTVVLTPGQ